MATAKCIYRLAEEVRRWPTMTDHRFRSTVLVLSLSFWRVDDVVVLELQVIAALHVENAGKPTSAHSLDNKI